MLRELIHKQDVKSLKLNLSVQACSKQMGGKLPQTEQGARREETQSHRLLLPPLPP